MKKTFYFCSIIIVGLLFQSCAKDIVDPELFGNIEGKVIDSETEDGLASVSITTAPATNSILSDEDGLFSINNIPVGNYTIHVKKSGYNNTSVSVSVREDETAIANVVMVEDEDEAVVTEEDLEAEITSWFNRQEGDSTYVEVEYKVSNISEDRDITEYEVYFEIQTEGETYFVDESGENLRAGQSSFIEFSKYIRQNTAQEVLISEVWVSD